MADTKKGLGGAPLQRREPKTGRKSASLVSAVRATHDEASVLNLALAEIADNPENPAARVEDVAELADSMREVGQLQPGLVVAAEEFVAEYPQHAEAVAGRAWVLLAGHRRRAAAQVAGLDTFQALRRDVARLDETVLHENVHRKALTAIEEAQAFARVMDRQGLSQRDMARHAGVSQSHVAKRLKLLKLPEVLQQAVVEDVLAPAKAVELVSEHSEETLAEVGVQWADESNPEWIKSPTDVVRRAEEVVLRRQRVAAAKAMAEAEGVEFLEDPAATFGPRKAYDHGLRTKKDIEAARKRGDLAYAPTTAYGKVEPLAYRLSAPTAQDKPLSEFEVEQQERRRAEKEATKQRQEFLAQTVTRKPPTPEVTGLLTMTALAGMSMMSHVTGLARKLAQGAGIGPTHEVDWDWRDALEYVDKSSTREHLAWIITLAIWEDHVKNGHSLYLSSEDITYLEHLVQRGYVLSDFEKKKVKEARARFKKNAARREDQTEQIEEQA